MKTAIKYEVISLPTNRDRLSPQLKSLVETIDFLKEEINGRVEVDRDKVYKMWLDDIGLEENDKVFASYIHQLISFAFLERLNVKPKKTTEDIKKMMAKQLSLMSKEDRLKFMEEMTTVED